MRILVDQGCYELLNMGDVAMLQACVQRLSRQWPDAEIMIIAHPGTELGTYCPGARSAGRTSGQRLAQIFPERYRPIWQSIVPYVAGLVPRTPPRPADPRTAVQAVYAADLVVAAGGGYITDTWRWHATGVLGVLALAQRLGKPTAMLGQGLGPVTQRVLRAQASWVFPKLAVLGLREGRMGPDLAVSLGARPDAVTLTGDDALELVTCSPVDGPALGVNMRMAGYAGVDSAVARAVGDVVLSAAAAYRAPVVALPVSRLGADGDLGAIQDMVGRGDPRVEVVLRDLPSPRDLIAAAAGCRAIVTGSYHAAVFSLAQGVPAVCVTNSSYYDAKFSGLQALFPHACFITALDEPDFAGRLHSAIDEAWQLPAAQRSVTSGAAGDLRDAGRAAYARLRDVVDGRPATITSEATA